MVPEAFHDYFVASTGTGAALVGLLFVVVSIAPERTVMSGAPVERQAAATNAYTALLNAFFLSLVALLLLSPTNSALISALAGVLVGIYALGLTRAWQLLGGRSRQLNDWLTPLRDTEDRHAGTDTDQSLAASSARNDEPWMKDIGRCPHGRLS